MQPTNAHVRAFLPPRLNLIALPTTKWDYSYDYLPEFRRRVSVDALPGWVVLTTGDTGAPRP